MTAGLVVALGAIVVPVHWGEGPRFMVLDASFRTVPTLGANCMSHDGRFVVALSQGGRGWQVLLWDWGVPRRLPPIGLSSRLINPRVNATGQVVVERWIGRSVGHVRSFPSAWAPYNLSHGAGGALEVAVRAVSADGESAAGFAKAQAGMAMFVARGGRVAFVSGSPGGEPTKGSIEDLSRDGRLGAGSVSAGPEPFAVLARNGEVVRLPGSSSPGATMAEAFGISGDGRTVAGYVGGIQWCRACLWRDAELWQLPSDPAWKFATAHATSNQGRVVVGTASAYRDAPIEHVVWVDGKLLRPLAFLQGLGLGTVTRRWRSFEFWDVNEDGTLIAGAAIDPRGRKRAVLIRLATIAPP